MKISFISKIGSNCLVDELSLQVSVDDIDLDPQFFVNAPDQFFTVLGFPHGRGGAKHVIVNFV